jgi:hypothetical protein
MFIGLPPTQQTFGTVAKQAGEFVGVLEGPNKVCSLSKLLWPFDGDRSIRLRVWSEAYIPLVDMRGDLKVVGEDSADEQEMLRYTLDGLDEALNALAEDSPIHIEVEPTNPLEVILVGNWVARLDGRRYWRGLNGHDTYTMSALIEKIETVFPFLGEKCFVLHRPGPATVNVFDDWTGEILQDATEIKDNQGESFIRVQTTTGELTSLANLFENWGLERTASKLIIEPWVVPHYDAAS